MAALTVLSLAFALLAAGGSAAPAPESRIFGGEPTEITQYPFVVSAAYTYPGPMITIQRCVAGLLSSNHLITTAYCFTGANLGNFQMRAGSSNSLSGGFVTTISDVVKHPDYQEAPRIADLAVVFVSDSIGLTPSINIMLLPYRDYHVPDGLQTTVVGWGFDSNGVQLEQLKYINMNVIGNAECEQIYKENGNVTIDYRVICGAGPNVGLCLGDSGTPMVSRLEVGGTTSFVALGLNTEFDECGNDDADIFTRVQEFTQWIVDVTRPRSSPYSSSYRDGPKTVRLPRMISFK